MLISYDWLQTFFLTPLPRPDEVADALTFHSSEIESIETVGGDTVLEVKVLPDKSAWMLSHRGVAKELSAILNLPLSDDPLINYDAIQTIGDKVVVTLETSVCDCYCATLIEGVTVGPSPQWLKERLEAVGQKSINNIVDITNYVMLTTGQPLHAFDAAILVQGDGYAVGVRQAKDGEQFVSLTKEEYILTDDDSVIIDGQGAVLALAGVKGGLHSGISDTTTSIILEAAHFDRTAVRKTSQRHKLPTDASKRYENGIPKMLISPSVALATKLFAELAGGTVVSSTQVGEESEVRPPVSVSLSSINSLLGLHLTAPDVEAIIKRFGYTYTATDNEFCVTPSPERDDLVITADVVEEIGRIYGLDKIESIPPRRVDAVAINKRHYYGEMIRQTLTTRGFSEVYTSSFRSKDVVKIKNALASDKGYLRSTLAENLREAKTKNIPYRDLLGISAVQLFEIGTVFGVETEEFRVGLAVQTNTNYKAKTDDELWREAVAELESVLGVTISVTEYREGVVEFSLDELLSELPEPGAYLKHEPLGAISYQSFSSYPPVSRDIAMWVGEGTEVEDVAAALRAAAGDLLVTLTHLDTFTKDGRTSLAFRLVFQSKQKTLAGSEVDALMEQVYLAAAGQGWEAR